MRRRRDGAGWRRKDAPPVGAVTGPAKILKKIKKIILVQKFPKQNIVEYGVLKTVEYGDFIKIVEYGVLRVEYGVLGSVEYGGAGNDYLNGGVEYGVEGLGTPRRSNDST